MCSERQAAVRLEGVSFAYGERAVPSGLDLMVEKGLVTALIGPNGCGKSTTVKLVNAMLCPSSGRVEVFGRSVADYGRKELARNVAVLGQGVSVPSMEVGQLVMAGRFPHRGLLAPPTDEDRRIVREAMARAGVERFTGSDVNALSGGERQRVHLAMVLAQQAPIVIMGEPTTYMDVAACYDLMAIARELNADGTTVLMVLHDLNLALACCDRVALLRDGRLAAGGTPGDVVASGEVERTFGIRLRSVEEDGRRYWCTLPAR